MTEEREEEGASELRQRRATAAGSVWNGRECCGGEQVAHMHQRRGNNQGKEGREGSEGMGVNERSSKRASKKGSSLRAGSVRNATEGSEWRATCTPQALPSKPHTLFFASLDEEPTVLYMVSDEVEKVCMGR
jgi:hypothetical protein